MNSFAYDIITYLETESIVKGATGWDAEENNIPDSPNKMVMVEDKEGKEPEKNKSGAALVSPICKIWIRGEPVDNSGYIDTINKAKEISDALQQVNAETINTLEYININTTTSNPLNEGRDSHADGGRQVFSLMVEGLYWRDS